MNFECFLWSKTRDFLFWKEEKKGEVVKNRTHRVRSSAGEKVRMAEGLSYKVKGDNKDGFESRSCILFCHPESSQNPQSHFISRSCVSLSAYNLARCIQFLAQLYGSDTATCGQNFLFGLLYCLQKTDDCAS